MNDLTQLKKLAGIVEASPSRIVQHIKDNRPFFVISAERDYNDADENKKEMIKLKAALSNIPVGYIEQSGEWEGISEQSLFVTPREKLSENGINNFKDAGIKLMKLFDQMAIVFSDGNSIVFINQNGSVDDYGMDAISFSKDKMDDAGGHSSINGQPYMFSSPDITDKNAISRSISARSS